MTQGKPAAAATPKVPKPLWPTATGLVVLFLGCLYLERTTESSMVAVLLGSQMASSVPTARQIGCQYGTGAVFRISQAPLARFWHNHTVNRVPEERGAPPGS